jgi:hypothetical protein
MMRCVLALDRPDPRAEEARLHIIKTNLSRIPDPVGITLADTGPEISARVPEGQRFDTLKDRACAFLELRLRKGPLPASSLYEEAEQAGIGKRTLLAAKEKLGVVALHPDKEYKTWRWSLGIKTDDVSEEPPLPYRDD